MAKELNLPHYLLLAGVGENIWIHAFSKSINAKWNINSLIQVLNLSYQFHLQQRFYHYAN